MYLSSKLWFLAAVKETEISEELFISLVGLFFFLGLRSHRRRFQNDFIQSTRSAPLRANRVSKEAKLYKAFRLMQFLLYFWLRVEKTLKNGPKFAKVPSNDDFETAFLVSFNFVWKVELKIEQIHVLCKFPHHFTPQRAQGVNS